VKKALLAILLAATASILVYGLVVTRQERMYRQYVGQGDQETRRGDHFAAVAAFTSAIGFKPDSMLGYLKRGEAQQRRGDLEAAAADFQQAAAIDPSSPRIHELLGDVDAARRRHEGAAGHYAASVKLDDLSPRVLYKLGVSRHLAGHDTAALDALTRASQLDGRFAEAHYMLGVCFRALDRPREAEDAFKRALALAPALIAAREQLADVYGSQGRRTSRIAELDRLLTADPGPARQIALALAHASVGDAPRAVRLLSSASGLYPDEADVYIALGRVWLDEAREQGDHVALGKALEALQHAVAMEPSGHALSELGRARLAAPDPALAERTLRQATETLPAPPSAFLHLAQAAERNGHLPAARRALLHFAALAGDDVAHYLASEAEGPRPGPGLLLRLVQAQLEAGDPASARRTLTGLLDKDPDNAQARALLARLPPPQR
jgi:tetratricopeptide (TPR) repeat protein